MVAFQDVVFGVHLHVNRGKAPAGAVIVDHQVVDAKHPVVPPEFFQNVGHKFFVGSLSQQGAQRLANQLDAGNDNEYGDSEAYDAVQHGKSRQFADNGTDQDGRRHQNVVAAVGRSGLQGSGINDFTDLAVKKEHPEL